MSDIYKFDFIVVGAGVIGIAIAMRCAQKKKSVLLIEKNSSFGEEISSRNSEVIHAGIYYPEGSLKAKFCRDGMERLYKYCNKKNIPIKKTGKLIVQTNPKDQNKLLEIFDTGIKNGCKELLLLNTKEINKIEPEVAAENAIWSPKTGVFDSHQFMKAMLDDFESANGIAVYNHNLKKVFTKGTHFELPLDASTTLNFPASGGARYGDVYVERPVHFEEPANTGNNMIIGLPLTSWESTPSIGDEIAAYGEDGELIGSTTFQGDHIALTIWGDDLTTDKKDGISEGESISFKLWNSQTGVEQTLEVRWTQGVGFYTTDGISIAGQIILGSELAAEKQLVRITDMLGREVNGDEKDVMLLYIYDDGSIERVYIKE